MIQIKQFRTNLQQHIGKSLATLAVGASLLAPSLGMAGVAATGKESKPVIEPAKEESRWSGDLGLNVVSQYVSRGLVQENQGFIAEPYADLYLKLYEGDGFVNKVQLVLGLWSSFHSRKTFAAAGSTTGSWYEFDFTPGVAITFLKNFTLTPSYYWYLSPSDAFATFQGINVRLDYDDTGLLGKFALHPHFTTLFELDNKAGSGASKGVYYEIGVTPGLPVGPVALTFPLNVGLGSNHFYTKTDGSSDAFGYFSAGANAALPLKFIPQSYGTWTVNAGATYYYLGDAARDYAVDAIRNDNRSEWVFQGGIGVAF